MGLLEKRKKLIEQDKENQGQPQEKKQEEEISYRELKEILAETIELNQLMKSYINVQMDKEAITNQTIMKEIEAMEQTSTLIQDKMMDSSKEQDNMWNNKQKLMRQTFQEFYNQIQEQEQKQIERLEERELKQTEKLEKLNNQIVENTKEGLNIVRQNTENLSDKLKNNINKSNTEIEKHIEKSFNECYEAIKKLKAHLEHRDFMEQFKIAFPIALLASAMSIAMVYFIFK